MKKQASKHYKVAEKSRDFLLFSATLYFRIDYCLPDITSKINLKLFKSWKEIHR